MVTIGCTCPSDTTGDGKAESDESGQQDINACAAMSCVMARSAGAQVLHLWGLEIPQSGLMREVWAVRKCKLL